MGWLGTSAARYCFQFILSSPATFTTELPRHGLRYHPQVHSPDHRNQGSKAHPSSQVAHIPSAQIQPGFSRMAELSGQKGWKKMSSAGTCYYERKKRRKGISSQPASGSGGQGRSVAVFGKPLLPPAPCVPCTAGHRAHPGHRKHPLTLPRVPPGEAQQTQMRSSPCLHSYPMLALSRCLRNTYGPSE